MEWLGSFLLIDGVVLISALIWYWGRPKPQWLTKEINMALWIARALRIIRRAKSYAKIK
jgi:hypothetical protein